MTTGLHLINDHTPGLRQMLGGEVAESDADGYRPTMSWQRLEQEALHRTEGERASLVLSLMETLGAPDGDVTVEEVARRDAELHDASVHPISQEEFVRRVRAAQAA